MSATDRAFRRELIRRARAAVRDSPQLNAEYGRIVRARFRPWRTPLPMAIGIALAAVYVLAVTLLFFRMLLVSGIYARLGADGVLVAVSSIEAFVACGFAVQLQCQLRTSKWLTVTSNLPMSSRQIACRAWLVVAGWSSLCLYPVLFAMGFVAYAERLGATGWCAALGIGVAQWLASIGLGTVLAVYRASSSVTAAGALAIPVVFVYLAVGAPALPVVATLVYAMSPAGWLSAVFILVFLQGAMWGWVALVPAVLVVAAGAKALRKLLATYRIRELTLPNGMPALADSDYWSARVRGFDQQLLPKLVRFFLQRIRSTAVPTRRWARYLDRWQRRFLTQREIDVVAFMTGDHSRWNQVYLFVLITNLAAIPLHWVFPHVAGQLGIDMLPMIISISSFGILFQNGGAWVGFGSPLLGGVCVPRFAMLPVGFNEVSRLIAKVACYRAVLMLPLLTADSFHVTAPLGATWIVGFVLGPVLAILYILGQGWLVAIRFAATMSVATPRLANIHWQIALAAASAVGTIVLFFLTFVGFVSTMLMLETVGWLTDGVAMLLFGGGLILLLSWSPLSWIMVRAMYCRGEVDLVRSRPSIGQRMWLDHEQRWFTPPPGH